MKTYVLGNAGDRILTVKKAGGEPLVIIKLKEDARKFIELTPKRLVLFSTSLVELSPSIYFLFFSFRVENLYLA